MRKSLKKAGIASATVGAHLLLRQRHIPVLTRLCHGTRGRPTRNLRRAAMMCVLWRFHTASVNEELLSQPYLKCAKLE